MWWQRNSRMKCCPTETASTRMEQKQPGIFKSSLSRINNPHLNRPLNGSNISALTFDLVQLLHLLLEQRGFTLTLNKRLLTSFRTMSQKTSSGPRDSALMNTHKYMWTNTHTHRHTSMRTGARPWLRFNYPAEALNNASLVKVREGVVFLDA